MIQIDQAIKYKWVCRPHLFAQHISKKWIPFPYLVRISNLISENIGKGGGRLIISLPPRHGKSELISKYTPAWFLNLFPDKNVILASYGDELARHWGRAVRNILSDHSLLDTNLSQDSTAAYRFSLKQGGSMLTCGIGGSVTGRGGDLIIVDDPVKNWQEAKSSTIQERTIDWFNSTLYSRAEDDTTIIILQCMTGETLVLMADGTEKQLRNIRPGESIATYKNGKLGISKIKNWKCQGPDYVFQIKTKSGISVRANERHPFLVYKNGALEWTRLRDLRVTDKMMRLKDLSRESCATSTDAKCQRNAKGFACHTTTNSDERMEYDHYLTIRNHEGHITTDTDTESILKNINGFSIAKPDGALSAKNHQLVESIYQNIGRISALTTTTNQTKYEDCCVMNATLLSNATARNEFCSAPLDIYDFIPDEIVEICSDGIDDVFDIEVEQTGNFIANGIISHNTRWDENDLSGYLLNEHASEWTSFNLPALAEENDPLGREIGEALCPERYPASRLQTIKSAIGSAMFDPIYQGNPMPKSGVKFKHEMLRFYKSAEIHDSEGKMISFDTIIHSEDFTFEGEERHDWNVIQVWGLRGDKFYLLAQVRERASFVNQVKMIYRARDDWPNYTVSLIEKKANGAALIDYVKDDYLGIIEVVPTESKEVRADYVMGLFESGRVWIPDPSEQPWVEEYIKELLKFPKSKHKDQVDCTTQALRYLRDMREPRMRVIGSDVDDDDD